MNSLTRIIESNSTNRGDRKSVDLIASRRPKTVRESLEYHCRPAFLHDPTRVPSLNYCHWVAGIPWKSNTPKHSHSNTGHFRSRARRRMSSCNVHQTINTENTPVSAQKSPCRSYIISIHTCRQIKTGLYALSKTRTVRQQLLEALFRKRSKQRTPLWTENRDRTENLLNLYVAHCLLLRSSVITFDVAMYTKHSILIGSRLSNEKALRRLMSEQAEISIAGPAFR